MEPLSCLYEPKLSMNMKAIESKFTEASRGIFRGFRGIPETPCLEF